MWIWLSTAFALSLPEKTISTTLQNGLSVLIVPTESDVVAVQTWVRVGSGDEFRKGESGYAHFFEHLMFHGTPSLSRSERQARLMRLGAEENAWTSNDFTCYHLIAPSDSVVSIIEIEADRFQNLSLTQAGVRREAGAVLGEFRKGRSSVNRVAYEELLSLVYKKHPYRHGTIGIEADVRNMPDGYETALDFYRRYYQPANTVVVVVGHVDPQSVMNSIESEYGTWQRDELAFAGPPEEPLQRRERRKNMKWTANSDVRQIQLAYPLPKNNPTQSERYSLEIVSRWLASATGPIQPDLIRSENAPIIDFRVDVDVRRETGIFWIRATLSESADMAEVEGRITDALESLEGLDSEIVNVHGEALARSWLLRLSSSNAWANQLGNHLSRGGDISTWGSIPEKYRMVSYEQIQQDASKVFQSSKLNAVWVNP